MRFDADTGIEAWVVIGVSSEQDYAEDVLGKTRSSSGHGFFDNKGEKLAELRGSEEWLRSKEPA